MTLSKSSDFGLARWAERDMLWGVPRTLRTEYSGTDDAGTCWAEQKPARKLRPLRELLLALETPETISDK